MDSTTETIATYSTVTIVYLSEGILVEVKPSAECYYNLCLYKELTNTYTWIYTII